MDSGKIRINVEDGLASIPLLDVHTHLDAAYLSARGLHDVLLYHMVISDLVSAGCPNRARLSEIPDTQEVNERIREALTYLHGIRNTSIYWLLRRILHDLYDWNEPVNEYNWKKIDARIRERSTDSAWPYQILRRAGIHRSSTELWRRRDGRADDIFHYSLEWAFFTRAQWGVNDIPLYELERAWNQSKPEPPLPVTLGYQRPPVERSIRNVNDVHEAIAYYVAHIPFNHLISTAQHISTDIHFRDVSPSEMDHAIRHRNNASLEDRDIYASYILEGFLTELEPYGDEIVYQFSIGAEPLPFETGSKLRQETIFELASIIERHPKIKFHAFLSNAHTNQSICTLARELPNLTLVGYWWHNFFPSFIHNIINERLDMLAADKQIGFFSDAYCVDWAYAKAVMVRKIMADVLTQKIVIGQYTLDEALDIARQVFFVSPQSLLKMQPSQTLAK